MNYSQALELMKQGKFVKRPDWNYSISLIPNQDTRPGAPPFVLVSSSNETPKIDPQDKIESDWELAS